MRERQVGPSTQMARVESFLVRQRHLRVVQQKKKNVIPKKKEKQTTGTMHDGGVVAVAHALTHTL